MAHISDALLAVINIGRGAKAGALLGLPDAPVLVVPRADAARIPCIPPCEPIPPALAILQVYCMCSSTANIHVTAHW